MSSRKTGIAPLPPIEPAWTPMERMAGLMFAVSISATALVLAYWDVALGMRK